MLTFVWIFCIDGITEEVGEKKSIEDF